ncbi:MAG: hypothetical protein NT030_02770 [Candidatus Saganbacteria bacterium]|nr:hypothetical protein [Candidatus Saganbacteria bacterium]
MAENFKEKVGFSLKFVEKDMDMPIQKTSTKPMDPWHYMAKGAIKNGLLLKAMGQSIKNLARLAAEHPQVSQKLWTHLIETKAFGADHIKFPSVLMEKQDYVAKIDQATPQELISTEGKKTVLDLGRLVDVAKRLRPKSVTEEEVQNLSLLSDIRKIYLKYYLSLLLIGNAGRNGELDKREELRFDIEELKNKLPALIERLRSVNKPYRKEIDGHLQNTIRLHEQGNISAANTTLISAYSKLEKMIDDLEKTRLYRREKRKGLRSPIKAAVRELNIKDYRIKKLPDGTWIEPQKGYKKVEEGIYLKDKIEHRIPEKDVGRRTQHIIDSISNEKMENLKHLNLLKEANKFIESCAGYSQVNSFINIKEGEKASVKSAIAPSLEHYMKAISRRKKKIGDYLGILLDLIEGNLFKQAKIILQIAIDGLEDRNIGLEAQIEYFRKKGHVELNDIERTIRRDEDLKSKARSYIKAFPSYNLWFFKKLRNESLRLYRIADNLKGAIEPGIRRAGENFIKSAGRLDLASDYIEMKYANRDNPVKLKELSEKAAKHILSASKWLALAEWNIDNKYTEEIDIKLVGKELLSKYANEFKNIQLL